jgi:hypothetical protein
LRASIHNPMQRPPPSRPRQARRGECRQSSSGWLWGVYARPASADFS